jgi:hypothetical protein
MVYKPTGERKLFELIWSISDKRSFISGRKLPFEVGSDLWFSCFAHVLSKKQWPYFRLYIGNVSTLHPDEHMIYDKGTIDDQKKYTRDWPLTKWDELVRLKAGLTREYWLAFPTGINGVQMKWFLSEIKDKIYTLNYVLLEKLAEDDFISEEKRIVATKVLAGL